MGVYIRKTDEMPGMREALQKLAGISEFEAYRFFDDFAGFHKEYDAYKVIHPEGTLILKKTDDSRQAETEQKIYRMCQGLCVPHFYGSSDGYMLTGYIDGTDLKSPSNAGIRAAGISLAEIINAFPPGRDYDRSDSERDLAYKMKQTEYLCREPLLLRAYGLLLERLGSIPLTLVNGDLVPINCIYTGEKVYLIDWEYGGFYPYSYDIARFMAHSGETGKETYRLSAEQKQLFVQTIYDNLNEKPDRNMFERDIRLAVLHEYAVILRDYLKDPEKPRDEVFGMYYEKASELARELLQ